MGIDSGSLLPLCLAGSGDTLAEHVGFKGAHDGVSRVLALDVDSEEGRQLRCLYRGHLAPLAIAARRKFAHG